MKPAEYIHRKIRKEDQQQDIAIPKNCLLSLVKKIKLKGSYNIPYIDKPTVYRSENKDEKKQQTGIDQDV
jgi:hypothetical protein